ncbi:MAG: hypothetical protein FJ403_17870 [Verrucomicrobia bacterium]|nr:hypothetical protein [Verrucomicrobiota bacterium]
MKAAASSFVARLISVLLPVLGATVGLWFLFAATQAPSTSETAESDLFERTNLLRIAIEVPEEGMQILRRSQPSRNLQVKPQAKAAVKEGGRVYENVAVQLKGFSSFNPIDGLPGLTLNFAKFATNQQFHGLSKISLNNSVQDRTLLHEKLSREMFAAAGVPVPRSDYAVVTLNGRELGLYVMVEGYDTDFLKRHFKRSDGNLYDGGVLQDIDRPLEFSSGKNPTNHSALEKLVAATREQDPTKRFQLLEAALEMDRFLSMVAMETILCHSDSYSMNRNNYRVYHDPSSDKIVFMPHGMDRVLGEHRSGPDLSIVPPMLGMAARAALHTPEGRRRYMERAGFLFTNLFHAGKLCARLHEVQARVARDLKGSDQPIEHGFDRVRRHISSRAVENLCGRISARAADLKEQMERFSDFATVLPSPLFNSDGVASLGDWKPRSAAGRAKVLCETKVEDGRQILHLQSPAGPLITSLRNQVMLPVGRYALVGLIRVASSSGVRPVVSASVLRYSAGRFGAEPRDLNPNQIQYEFQVPGVRAPEEIEFICDIRDSSGEVRFDASSLRLIRLSR